MRGCGNVRVPPTYWNANPHLRGLLRRQFMEPQCGYQEATGIPREYLLRLMRKGHLHRTGRGMYELADASPTEHHSLALVAKGLPQGVICLLSSLCPKPPFFAARN